MFEYSFLNIRVYVCVTNTNIMVNEYFFLKRRIRISLSLLTIMCYYEGIGEKLKYQKLFCATIFASWLCIPREILITRKNGNVLLRVMCSITLTVCLHWDVTECLRPYACVRLERQAEREGKRVTDYIGIHASWLELCVASRKCEDWERELLTCRVHVGLHVTWPAPNTRFILRRTKSNTWT